MLSRPAMFYNGWGCSEKRKKKTPFSLFHKVKLWEWLFIYRCVFLQYPVYFAFEDDDIDAVLADVKRNDAIGQPATATNGGYNCCLLLNISDFSADRIPIEKIYFVDLFVSKISFTDFLKLL